VRILSLKPGHDGAIAFVEDGRLVFSIEAEKDSFPRYGEPSASLLVQAMEMAPGWPDVVATGGWHKYLPEHDSEFATGYLGLDRVQAADGKLFGRRVRTFSSSHERSHIFMAAAMAPEAPLDECAILVWEGVIGAVYHWRDGGATIEKTHVLDSPGKRYSALFALADPTFPDHGTTPRLEDAGKLMALAGYSARAGDCEGEPAVVDALLDVGRLFPFDKACFRDSPLHNCGLQDPRLHVTARLLSDRLFDIFARAACRAVPPGLPLLVAGGCGLNCEWNRRWRECPHFRDVFVAPCANDSGSAIGTAADAAVAYGLPCRLDWDVYAGPPFRADAVPDPSRWSVRPLRARALADRLLAGEIVAWVQGRCEIGPRALGHRSLLASPLVASSKDRLNRIKGRAGYRPIAPCCLVEELPRWFDCAVEDPYMLYFARVRTGCLPAVTHVDGSARVQSVGSGSDPALRELLAAFRQASGFGVLCNTSLNFRGRGFINGMCELLAYCELKDIREVVVDGAWYTRTGEPASPRA
jgi:hydroxymethyl cephem carbamoyltransferase